MRTRYKIYEQKGIHFITSSIVGWIPIFTKEKYFDIIIKTLKYSKQYKKLHILSYVIMDNHIHAILSCDNLSKFMKEFKSYTAKEIIRNLGDDNNILILKKLRNYKKRGKTESRYQVWQEGFHPQEILNEEILKQKIEYIHNNPLRRGLVERPEQWIYSSASNYILGTGLIDIDILL